MLRLSTSKAERHAWAVIPAAKGGWDLARRATVSAEIVNTGDKPAGVMLWVVGDHGWGAVLDTATLAPQETRIFSCNLREAYPDGTPKLNPSDVKQVQVMLAEPIIRPAKLVTKSKVQPLLSPGNHQGGFPRSPAFDRPRRCAGMEAPAGRIDVPAVEESAPAPGKRVRYRLPGDEKSGIYSVLNLPEDWQPERKIPSSSNTPATSSMRRPAIPRGCRINASSAMA